MGVGMSSISIIIDDATGWRNTIRIICCICWAMAIPMFFIPEPERNATNRLEAEIIKKAVAEEADNFDHLNKQDTPLIEADSRGSLQKN